MRMIEQFDSIFDAKGTDDRPGTDRGGVVPTDLHLGTSAAMAKSSAQTKGLKLTVPVSAVEAHEVLHAWAEALRRNPALKIPAPGEAMGTGGPVGGNNGTPADNLPFDLIGCGGTQPSEADLLRDEVRRLQDELTAACASLVDAKTNLDLVSNGQLEIALAELASAQNAASQAKRAREVQAANHAVVVSQLNATVAAYKTDAEKLSRRAKFGTAVLKILERLPGHIVDPKTKLLRGPNEVEILRYLEAGRAAHPNATDAFKDLAFKALRPTLHAETKTRRWYQFFAPRRSTAVRK